MPPPDQRLDELFALFATYGDAHYDEEISLTDHCLQTAQHAVDAGADDHLVAAALLHDVGHFILAAQRGTEDYLHSDWDHDAVGACYLAGVFGVRIARTVGLHVAAKRYLCGTDSRYLAVLSPASIASLKVQGGPMKGHELSQFEQQECWNDAVLLRRWDDAGKSSHALPAHLVSYRTLLNGLSQFKT